MTFLAFQRVTVEWIAWAGLDAHPEAFLVGDGEAHLHPEFVGLGRRWGLPRKPSSWKGPAAWDVRRQRARGWRLRAIASERP